MAELQARLHDRHRDPQHAAGRTRVSDLTAFFTWARIAPGTSSRWARPTEIFTNPKNQLTEDYVSGRFG